MFVVARTDLVRIFVDVPETYAGYVKEGTKALVCAQALCGRETPATVTRTSWGLESKTRSLRTEIDLSVKEHDIRPGMYVYGNVVIQRPRVLALPQNVLLVQGNQTYCFLLRDGKAVRALVESGMSDGTWTEMLRKKVGESWTPFTGQEQVLVGDLSELADGQPVDVTRSPGS